MSTKIEQTERPRGGQRSFLDWLGGFGSEDIGIDLGTSQTVVYVKDKGLVFPEASVIATEEKTGRVLAYGSKAEGMEGRTPLGVRLSRPLKNSSIVDYRGAISILDGVVNRSYLRSMLLHPRLMICVPAGLNGVQRRALLEAAVSVGARKTVLIEQPLATVMGLGIQMNRLQGVFLVDIGGGSAKISAVSRQNIVSYGFFEESGLMMDQAVMSSVMDKYHVRIGRRAAEKLKIEMGASWNIRRGNTYADVYGTSLITGLPVKISVSSKDVAEALHLIVYKILSHVRDMLQRVPPAVLADVRDHGIMLVGGAAQLKGLSVLITRVTGMPAFVAEQPSYVNAVGAGMSLAYMDYFRDSLRELQ